MANPIPNSQSKTPNNSYFLKTLVGTRNGISGCHGMDAMVLNNSKAANHFEAEASLCMRHFAKSPGEACLASIYSCSSLTNQDTLSSSDQYLQ